MGSNVKDLDELVPLVNFDSRDQIEGKYREKIQIAFGLFIASTLMLFAM